MDRNPATTLFTPRNCRAGRERLVLNPDLATWEGMRRGEILALQLGDLDGDSLWVRRRLYKGDLDVPKTRRSSRQAALATATLALLKEWTSRFLESEPDVWLFPSENGFPLRRDNLSCRYMLRKRSHWGWNGQQVMPRTFATLSKEAGVARRSRKLRQVSEWHPRRAGTMLAALVPIWYQNGFVTRRSAFPNAILRAETMDTRSPFETGCPASQTRTPRLLKDSSC